MRHPFCLDLYRCWESIKPDYGFPQRKDFNPMAVPQCLPHLFMLERRDDDVRPRLTGSHIDEILSGQIDGGSVFDIYEDEVEQFHRELFSILFRRPCGATLHGRVEHDPAGGKDTDSIFLPIIKDGQVLLMGICIAKDPQRQWENHEWIKRAPYPDEVALISAGKAIERSDFSEPLRPFLKEVSFFREEEMIPDGEPAWAAVGS